MSEMIEAPHADGLDDDRLREECGVFGVFGHPDAPKLGCGKPMVPLTLRPGAFDGMLGAPSGGAVAGSNGDIV